MAYKIGRRNRIPSTQKSVLIATLKSMKKGKFCRAFSICPSPIRPDTSAQPPVAIIVPMASVMARKGPAMLTAESASVPRKLDTKS